MTSAVSAPPVRRRRQVRARLVDDVAAAAVAGMIVLSVLLLIVPLVMTLSMSFDARDYLGAFPPTEFSLRWYDTLFSDPYLLKGLKTSPQLATLTAVVSTALGLAAAVALDRLPGRHTGLAISLFLSPLIVPGVVIGFALLLFYSRASLDDTFLRL